jgi:hypothetical protein
MKNDVLSPPTVKSCGSSSPSAPARPRIDDRAPSRIDLRLDRRLLTRRDDPHQVGRDGGVVDDRLDDPVRDVPIADAALGIGAAEQQRRVGDPDLLRHRLRERRTRHRQSHDQRPNPYPHRRPP